MDISCPKCNWSMHSFNCGPVIVGLRCDNDDCGYEQRPENKAVTLQAQLDKWPRVFFKSMDPRSDTEGFRVLSVGGKENSWMNVTIDVDGEEIFAPSDFGLFSSKESLDRSISDAEKRIKKR